MGLKEFQKDLQNGMTLEKALKKHELTFKEAWDLCPKPCGVGMRKPRTFAETVAKHIQKKGNSFYLRKNLKGKTESFGVYYSLEDAESVRDFCILNGWNWVKVREACKKYGVRRKH